MSSTSTVPPQDSTPTSAYTSLRRQVVDALRWSASGKFFVQIVTWAITLVVIRFLSPSDYGLLALATVFTDLLNLLNELGLGSAVVQQASTSRTILKRIFGLVILSNVACFAALQAAAPLISSFYDEPRLVPIVRVLATQFLLTSIGIVPNALLVRSLDFRKKMIVEILARLLSSFLTLVMAYAGYGVWALVASNLLAAALRAVGFVIGARFFCLPSFSIAGLRGVLSFGGNIVFQRVAWFMYSQSDVFVIGRLLGSEILGFYSVALHLASLPMQKFNEVINQITFRAFASLHAENKQVQAPLIETIRLLSFLSFPLFYGIAAVAAEIVSLFFGEKWASATLPLQLLPLVMPLRMVNTPISETLNAVGRPGVVLANLAWTLVILPPSILVGARYGLLGVCLAWLVAFPVLFLMNVSRAAPCLGVSGGDLLRPMRNPALATFGMYLIVSLARVALHDRTGTAATLALLIVAGILSYLGLVRLFAWREAAQAARFAELRATA